MEQFSGSVMRPNRLTLFPTKLLFFGLQMSSKMVKIFNTIIRAGFAIDQSIIVDVYGDLKVKSSFFAMLYFTISFWD